MWYPSRSIAVSALLRLRRRPGTSVLAGSNALQVFRPPEDQLDLVVALSALPGGLVERLPARDAGIYSLSFSAPCRRILPVFLMTLSDPVIAGSAHWIVRGLIERVSVTREDGQAVVALDGALMALIGLAQNAKGTTFAESFGSSVILVAGARNRRNLPTLQCFV